MSFRFDRWLSSLCRCALALGLLVAATASADYFEPGKGLDDPQDRSTDIFCGEHQLGTLSITDYFSWTSSSLPVPLTFNPQNPGLDANDPIYADRGGAAMIAEFDPDVALCGGFEYRWIQGVMSGVGTIGQNNGDEPPYLDPWYRDDGLPFYWTEAENANPNIGNGGLSFSDIPSQSIFNDGNAIHFEAAFVAVNLTTMEICWLAGFTWGYSLENYAVHLNEFSWLNAPTGDLVDLINYWDGSNDPNAGQPDNRYMGDGDPDGWVVVEDCPLCECIPETGSTTLLLIGMTFAGGFVGLKRSRS